VFKKLLVTSVFLTAALLGQHEDIWLFCQDFYSFGKKDAYESLKQMYFEQVRKITKNNVPILTLQVQGNPEYISLVPVGNFSGVENYFSLNNEVKTQIGDDVWKKQQQAFKSTLNFQVFSIHRFLPKCSQIPKEGNSSLMNRPHVHYFIYSIEPGQETFFEDLLERKSLEHAEKKTGSCWRVWKVLLGADIPKYVLAIFSISEDTLGKEVSKVDIVDPEIEKILRRERDGKAIFRADLSYLPRISK
jgi:hypothetical protein